MVECACAKPTTRSCGGYTASLALRQTLECALTRGSRTLTRRIAMPKDMRTYIRQLEEQRPDDLVTVRQEVDPQFGVTAIIQKLEEEGRFPVVFFERVKGSRLPLVINLTAS